ncbi:MAG: hypothetical protein RSD49_08395 [Hafnia sp.]
MEPQQLNMNMKYGKWITDGSIPPDLTDVVIRYEGDWPNRGTNGYANLYAYAGQWFNVPDVTITGWMLLNKLLDTSEFLRLHPDEELVGIDPEKFPLGEWVADGSLPPEGHTVIAQYDGWWPGQGSGGVTALHAKDGKWADVPASANVTRWKYDPDKLPANH